MSIITLPGALYRLVNMQSWQQVRYDSALSNPLTGALQTVRLSPPRWLTAIGTHDAFKRHHTAIFESLQLALDGQINQLAVHDIKYPYPRGTARGAMVLASAVSGGDVGMTINAGVSEAGKTLLQGDALQIGAGGTRQVVRLLADAMVSGTGIINVSFAPFARWPQTNGGAVLWDKPTALFRSTTQQTTGERRPHFDGGFSLDLIESWDA